MRLKIIIIVLLVAAFGAIGVRYFSASSSQSLPIDESRFVKAYVALATLAERMPIGTPEYEQEKARVLSRIGLNPGQVEDALAQFDKHPDLWQPVWEQIQAELDRQNQSDTTAPQSVVASDSLAPSTSKPSDSL